MESFPQLYYDVRVVKLQLEYLIQVARAALQPCNRPKRDSHDQVMESKQVTADDITDNDDESVRLLDEILEKAQTARDASKKHGKINIAKKPSAYIESSTSRQQYASKSAGKMDRPVSKPKGGAQMVDKPETTDQCTVEKHSKKMMMPSKWSQLRMAIDKHSNDVQPVGKMEGDYFVQLLRQQGGSDPNINNLLVIRSEIDAIVEDVTSFPTECWTINSRNPWQAIYRIKHHLDLIQRSIAVVRKQIDEIPKTGLPSSPSITHQSSHRLTYSSLKELLDYVESYTSLQLQLYHLRINQLCKQHLLPAVSSDTSVDAELSANIRNLHSLIGLKCSPIFLHMANNNTS